MPCQVCAYYYMNNPCTGGELRYHKPFPDSTQHYTQHSTALLADRFKHLSTSCVCIECLVKMACTQTCDAFKDDINRWNKERMDRSRAM